MSAAELREWYEFYNLEPFGDTRDNWHTAMLATILVNANRKPSSPAAKLQEFMYTDSQTAREREEKRVLAWFEDNSVKVKH